MLTCQRSGEGVGAVRRCHSHLIMHSEAARAICELRGAPERGCSCRRALTSADDESESCAVVLLASIRPTSPGTFTASCSRRCACATPTTFMPPTAGGFTSTGSCTQHEHARWPTVRCSAALCRKLHGFLPELHTWHAACQRRAVQGTCFLTAPARRPQAQDPPTQQHAGQQMRHLPKHRRGSADRVACCEQLTASPSQ